MINVVKKHNCVCDCEHDKHGDPIQELWRFTANYYTSLLNKLKNHINNDNVHVTKEEKDAWDNKASKDSINDLEEVVKQIKSKLDNIEPSLLNDIKAWVESKNYVTHDELISYVKDYINKIISGEIDLTGYAKESWVLEQIEKITAPGGELDLSKYALKSDINDLVTRISSLESRISNIENNGVGKNYEITNVSVTGHTLTITQNNMGSKSVVLPSDGGGGSTTPGLTEDDVNAMLHNAKTLIINKNGEPSKSYNPFSSSEDITIDIVGSGGSGEDDNKYYQAFFQNKNSNTIAPAIPDTGKGPSDYPSTDEKSKWATNAENPSKGYYTWMTFAFVSNGVYGSWINPVCITGEDGEAGTDITGKEQIYKLAGEGQNVEKPTQNIKDQDDFVPRDEGWTDSPSGVSATVPCEWTCIRTKNTETNKWSDWSEPVLWSHYGHNGTDGDGVEYIYWAGHNDQAYPVSNPNTWYTDIQSKANEFRDGGSYSEEDGSDGYYNSKYYNKREFILAGTGWSDNPADLSSSYYGPGSRQYVSMRRKYGDNGGSSYWHKYSAPALWSNYAQNGDAGKGVSLNLDNGTMAVSLNSDKTNQLFDQTCTVRFYNGTNTVNIDTLEYSVIDANGSTVSTDSDFSITISQNTQDSNCKDVNVHISKGKFNFTNGGYTIKLTAKASITGEETTRYATIQLLGVNFGEDGISYKLSLSSSVIKLSRGSYYPNAIDVFVSKVKGTESIQQITPTQAITTNNKWSFKYSIDSASEQSLAQDTISQSLISSATNTIRVSAYFDNTLVDQQTAVIVKDGTNGQNGVSYAINIVSNTVAGKYLDDGSISYSGYIRFYVTKIVSNTSSANLTTSDVNVVGNLGGHNETYNQISPPFDSSSNQWVASVYNSTYSFVCINVTDKMSNMFYTSVVVPFSTPGKDGQDAAPQTLKGSPLRMRGTWSSGTEYFDGTVATTDGTMYQDVVVHNNLYYVCVNHDGLKANNWTQEPSSTTYWQKMAVTESFVTDKIIANQADIKELSSEEVVIKDKDKIVAGMTSSKAIGDKSDLKDKVTDKGDVRIWAGQFSGGNLTTAPFTVTNSGTLKATDANITGQINATSGSIGNFDISNGSLITGNSKIEIGLASSSGLPYRKKVIIDAKGNNLNNYNYMLSVVNDQVETQMNVGTTAGVYIDVTGNGNNQYCGINMIRGQFWGLRCATRTTMADINFRNPEEWTNFVSGMTIICKSNNRITITLPNKDFAKAGDEFTVLKGNDDYESQELVLSYTTGDAIGRPKIEGIGARIIFANGKWRICHYN